MTDRLDLPRRYREQLESLLGEHVPDVEVWAYGSRVNGRGHDASDLDIVLRGPALQPLGDGFFDLLEAIENSNIPILVQAHDWARLPESFHHEIERDYVVLQNRREAQQQTHTEWETSVYGLFPSNLAEASLGSLCDDDDGIQTGPFGSQLHQRDYVADGTPIITVEHLGENRISGPNMPHVSEHDRQRLSRYTLRKGDIVFSRVGSVDRRALVRETEEGWLFSGRCLRVRPDATRVAPAYLSYFFGLPAFKEYIRSIAVGATMPSLNTQILSDVPILYPALPEQRAIAHILGTLDDKIELNRRMNETLEAMARALFKSWFVDFEPVRAKMEGRDTGLPSDLAALFPDRLVDSELGEIPDGWEVGVLNDAIEILSGGTPKTSVLEYWGGGIPWYTAKDAPSLSDIFVLTTERSISQAGVENSSTKVLPAGTTVITARGTVGRLACLGTPMAMNQTCYGLRGASGYPDYFTYWNVRNTVSDLQARTHGTIFDTITRATFKIAETALAPVSVARAFESALGPLMDRILQNLNESTILTTQRDALLPGLVSGEVGADNRNFIRRDAVR